MRSELDNWFPVVVFRRALVGGAVGVLTREGESWSAAIVYPDGSAELLGLYVSLLSAAEAAYSASASGPTDS